MNVKTEQVGGVSVVRVGETRLMYPILQPKHRKILEDEGGVDFSWVVGQDECRFRVSLFKQRGRLSLVSRRVNNSIPNFAGLRFDMDDKGWHNYNGLQVQLQKRYSHGLIWQSYYTFSKGLTNLAVSNATQSLNWTTLRNQSLDRGPSGFDIRHVFQNTGTYDLPIGKNRLLKLNNHWLDTLIGGWNWANIVTIRSGAPVKFISGGAFNTVNNNDPGIFLAPGVTLSQIQHMMVNTQAANTSRYTFDKTLIGADGRASTQYFITPTAPGVWGNQLYVYNKNVFAWDSSITKNFKIKERGNLAIWAGATNILNHPNWGMGTSGTVGNINTLNIQSTTFSQTSGPINGARAMQFRGTLSF
jgi:hypothetical protein